MNRFYRWDGVKWVKLRPKKWNGSSWVNAISMMWDGEKWKRVANEVLKTKVWESTWSKSYDGNNNPRHTPGYIYQGKYGKYDPTNDIHHNPIYFGRQRSLIGFDFLSIQEAIRNKRVESIELFLHLKHSWYFAGATANIVSHKFTSQPNYFGYNRTVGSQKFTKRDEGRWIKLDNQFIEDLISGEATGLGIFRDSDNLEFYGYWFGAGTDYAPKLRIRYYDDEDSVEPDVVETPKPQPLYTKVLRGEGLVQVTERLMRQGLLSSDFFEARRKLMTLNEFSSSAPILHPDQLIRYK